MSKQLKKRYLDALELLNLKDVERDTSRSYRTLQAYRRNERRVTEDAAEELVAYLRVRAGRLNTAADRLEAALPREEGRDE
ncbi:hypothetical protein ACGF5M_03475 [Gemmatimonadota bacterium]